jgi:hypothetical protein
MKKTVLVLAALTLLSSCGASRFQLTDIVYEPCRVTYIRHNSNPNSTHLFTMEVLDTKGVAYIVSTNEYHAVGKYYMMRK